MNSTREGWPRRERPLLGVFAGFGLGLLFLALGFIRPGIAAMRTVDLVYLLATGWKTLTPTLARVGWLVIGFIGPAVLMLAFNAQVTGSASDSRISSLLMVSVLGMPATRSRPLISMVITSSVA